jgi:hypothetical protein
MALVSAAIGSTVTWEHMHQLASQLDDLASTLKIPGYKKLLNDETYPFKEPAVYDALPGDFRIHFDVNSTVGDHMGGSARVTRQYLSEGQESPWALPTTVLKNLASAFELFLTTKEDVCWCNSVHQVLPEGAGGAMLKTAPIEEEKRCCWRVNIPELGDDLVASDSAVINAVAVKYFVDGIWLRTALSEVWYTLPSCEDGGSMQYFKLVRTMEASGNASLFRLTAVERSITPNFLTWPVLKKYMQKLVSTYFLDILFQSSGAEMWKLREPNYINGIPEHAAPPNSYLPACPSPPGALVIAAPEEDEVDPPPPPPNPATPLAFSSLNPEGLPAWTSSLAGYDPSASVRLWTPPGCLPSRPRVAHTLWCELGEFAAEVPGSVTHMTEWPWDTLLYGAQDCEGAAAPTVYAETITQLSKMFDLAKRTVVPRAGTPKTPGCCFDGIGGWTSDSLIFTFTNEEFNLRFPACENSNDEPETGSPGVDEYFGITSGTEYTGDALWQGRCPTHPLPGFTSCGKLYKVQGMLLTELPVMLVLIRLYHFGYGGYCDQECQTWCGAQVVGCNVQLRLGGDGQEIVFEDRRLAKIEGPATPCILNVVTDETGETCEIQESLLPDADWSYYTERHVGFIVRGSSAKLDLTMKVTVTGEDQFAEDEACIQDFGGQGSGYTMGGMSFDIDCLAITEKAAESALAAWIARDTPEEPPAP